MVAVNHLGRKNQLSELCKMQVKSIECLCAFLRVKNVHVINYELSLAFIEKPFVHCSIGGCTVATKGWPYLSL